MDEKTISREETELIDVIESLEQEFTILQNKINLLQESIKTQTANIDKLYSRTERIETDLEIRSRPKHDTKTRQLSRDAFNQSTVQANWEGLKDHPEITALKKLITDKKAELQQQINRMSYRLDNERPANEVFEELAKHPIIIGIKSDIKRNQEEIGELDRTIDAKAAQINRHDLKLRDTLSDIQQVQNIFEFELSEMKDMFMNGFLFAIGAFATLGYDRVSEGLQTIIKPSREVKPKDETPK